ncbi:MAG: hypothetical protein RMK64_00985 [Rhodovarius sp.]|nr:hypothetical protein [Rhodovarius sp.]MDW8313518.1 hypothetical protein [Rhodovarius sp.]
MRGLQNPQTLAALAGGLVSALLALWAMRGLPLGGLLLWVAPAPLFTAGLGFGAAAAWFAAGVGTLLVALLAHPVAVAVYATLFALPSALLISLYLRPNGPDISLPVMTLGLYPVVVVLLLSLLLAGQGGLEAVLRQAVSEGAQRMGLALAGGMLDALVRVKAAVIGFWSALMLMANAALAQRFLARRGLALTGNPDLAEARMPGWYLGLLAVAAAAALLIGGTVALSVLLLLLLPFFLMGVASVHRRTRGRGGRIWLLAGFYAALVLFLQILAPALVGLGLYEQWARRAPPPPQT